MNKLRLVPLFLILKFLSLGAPLLFFLGAPPHPDRMWLAWLFGAIELLVWSGLLILALDPYPKVTNEPE